MNKIQELIEAGKKATQGEVTSNGDNPYDEHYYDLLTSACCCGEGRFKRNHDCDFFAKAANARTEIETLYTLAQEMAEALEALPLYSDKGSKKVWINCRVNGSAMWGLQNADKEIIESFEKIENMRQKALTKWETEFKK